MCATSTFKPKWVAAAVLVVAAAAQEPPKTDRFPLEKVEITGTEFPKDAVLRIVEIKPGEIVAPADFEAAAKKVQESGLFQNVAFRYGPGPSKGYVLSFEIADFPNMTPASIELPDVNQDEIWKCAAERFPVIPKRVPPNEAAERIYADAIERCLALQGAKEEIVARSLSSLERGKMEVLFQPKNLPTIAGLEFTGEKSLSQGALLAAMSRPAMGSGYTERNFRIMLNLNVVPLYEELGRLRISFPKVLASPSAGGTVSVATTVSEGEVYTLGSVTLSGDGIDKVALMRNASFRIGQVANWNDVRLHVAEVDKALRRDGYLAARLTEVRHFRDSGHTVDLEIAVNRGPQFHFGQLRLAGFSAVLEQKARHLWKLKPGGVMDQRYPYDFVRSLHQDPAFEAYRKFDVAMEPGAAGSIINVTISAK